MLLREPPPVQVSAQVVRRVVGHQAQVPVALLARVPVEARHRVQALVEAHHRVQVLRRERRQVQASGQVRPVVGHHRAMRLGM